MVGFATLKGGIDRWKFKYTLIFEFNHAKSCNWISQIMELPDVLSDVTNSLMSITHFCFAKFIFEGLPKICYQMNLIKVPYIFDHYLLLLYFSED